MPYLFHPPGFGNNELNYFLYSRTVGERCVPCCPDVDCTGAEFMGSPITARPLFEAYKYYVDIPPVANATPDDTVALCADGTFPLFNARGYPGLLTWSFSDPTFDAPFPIGRNDFGVPFANFSYYLRIIDLVYVPNPPPPNVDSSQAGYNPNVDGINDTWQLLLVFANTDGAVNPNSLVATTATYSCSANDFMGCGSAIMNLIADLPPGVIQTQASPNASLPPRIVLRSPPEDPCNCPCPCFLHYPNHFPFNLYVKLFNFNSPNVPPGQVFNFIVPWTKLSKGLYNAAWSLFQVFQIFSYTVFDFTTFFEGLMGPQVYIGCGVFPVLENNDPGALNFSGSVPMPGPYPFIPWFTWDNGFTGQPMNCHDCLAEATLVIVSQPPPGDPFAGSGPGDPTGPTPLPYGSETCSVIISCNPIGGGSPPNDFLSPAERAGYGDF